MTLPDALALPSAQPSDPPSNQRPVSPGSTSTTPYQTTSVPVTELIGSLHKPASSGSTAKGKGRADEMDIDQRTGAEGRSEGEEREELGDGDRSDTEGEEDDDYEEERQRRIRDNQIILANLGIQSSSSIPGAAGGEAGPSTQRQASPTSRRRKSAKNAPDVPIYDRSGYIISLPPPGQTHTMACVEMPSDRKLKRRINEGEYTDCSDWKEGEGRRWRYGYGRGGELAEGEEEYVGGVGKEFRWRKWKGLEKELRREMRLRGELVERDARPEEKPPNPEGVSAYSLIPGETCHQCRRKSDKRKMKCRNVNPVCKATFCETCCKRYSYFDFDEESRSFICPLCKDCCNCSNCIRKRNLAHLLEGNKGGLRRKSIKNQMGEDEGEMTVQAWLEKTVKDNIGAPFDCVRLVDQEYDIISPAISPEEEIADQIHVAKAVPAMASRKPKKRKEPVQDGEEEPKTGREKKQKKQKPPKEPVVDGEERPKPKRGRSRKQLADGQQSDVKTDKPGQGGVVPAITGGLKITLKIPKPSELSLEVPAERVKEVDSDGDTVGDWSSDSDSDDNSSGSALTSLTSSSSGSPAVAPRIAFPPRPVFGPAPAHDRDRPHDYYRTLSGVTIGVSHTDPEITRSPVRLTEANHRQGGDPVAHASPSRSSPENESDFHDHAGPKKRRKPPPKANIVRAPRHSSLSTNSSPTKAMHRLPVTSVDHGIAVQVHPPLTYTTTPEAQQPEEPFTLSSLSQRQVPMPTFAYPEDAQSDPAPLANSASGARSSIWQTRASSMNGYDTLLGDGVGAGAGDRSIESLNTTATTMTTTVGYPSFPANPPFINAFASTPFPHSVSQQYQLPPIRPTITNTQSQSYDRAPDPGPGPGPPPYSHSPLDHRAAEGYLHQIKSSAGAGQRQPGLDPLTVLADTGSSGP